MSGALGVLILGLVARVQQPWYWRIFPLPCVAALVLGICLILAARGYPKDEPG